MERANTPVFLVLLLAALAGAYFIKAQKDSLTSIDRSQLEIARHTLKNSNRNAIISLDTAQKQLQGFSIECSTLSFKGDKQNPAISLALQGKAKSKTYTARSCDMRFSEKSWLDLFYQPQNNNIKSQQRCLNIYTDIEITDCTPDNAGDMVAQVLATSRYDSSANPVYKEQKMSSKARFKVKEANTNMKRACAHALNKNCMQMQLFVGSKRLSHQAINLPCNTDPEYFDPALKLPNLASILTRNSLSTQTKCLNIELQAQVSNPRSPGSCAQKIRLTLSNYVTRKQQNGEAVKFCPTSSSSKLPAVAEYPGSFGCSYNPLQTFKQVDTFKNAKGALRKRFLFDKTSKNQYRIRFEDSTGKATDFDDYWLEIPSISQGYQLGIKDTKYSCP